MNIFISDRKELRSGWKILRLIVFIFLFLILFVLAASALNSDALGEYAFHLAVIGAVLLELRITRKPLAFIGLNLEERVFWKDLLLGLAWGGLSIGLAALGMIFITREIHSGEIGQGLSVLSILGMLVFWLVVSVAEENLFRGYILSILKNPVGVRTAMVISAVLFTALHLLNPEFYWFAFLYAFLIGLMFGEVVIRRGNLGCVIGFHFIWNFLQEKGLLSFPIHGGEAVFTIILLINLALIIWRMPRGAAAMDWD
jgi:membrane protease YdiL (CAAX protease family)